MEIAAAGEGGHRNIKQRAADHSEQWATLFVVVRPRPIVAIVTSRPIVAIVRSRPIVTIIRSRPIVPIVRPRLVIATSGRVGACFNDRTAWSAELWSISPQARHDSVHIGNLRAAQPPNIRRAGHLLFCGSSILLRTRHILSSDAATDRNRKAHENSMRSHAQSLFHKRAEVPHVDYFSSRFKINAAFQRQNVKASALQCHEFRAVRKAVGEPSTGDTIPQSGRPGGTTLTQQHGWQVAQKNRGEGHFERNNSLARRSTIWTLRVHLHTQARLVAQPHRGFFSRFARSVLRHIRVISKQGFRGRCPVSTMSIAIPSSTLGHTS